VAKLTTQTTSEATASATSSKPGRLAVVTAPPVSGCAVCWWSITVFAMRVGYPNREQRNGGADAGSLLTILAGIGLCVPSNGYMDVVTSVVVVGSGFTGFECARRLARRLRKTDVDVTIISPVDYMLYTPLLPDVAGGVVDARFVAIPLAGTLNGVRAIRGRVDSVDLQQHRLQFTDLEQRTRELSWDRLVLTPGSVTRLFDIPGLAQYARGLKSVAEALYLRDHVLEQLELSCLEEDVELAQARRTIVVVGASYSGTELVLQLRALAHAAAKQMNFDPTSVKFLLLDLAEQVMPEVGEKLGARAQKVLRQRGIDVRLGLTLNEVHPGHVVLSDDSRVNAHTVAWVTGVTAAPLIETLELPTEKGRLKVQTDLAVPGHPDVFAAGDAAAVPDVTQPASDTVKRAITNTTTWDWLSTWDRTER
jgi:NADH dehydrogenase